MKHSQFKTAVEFANVINAKKPGNVATIGISLEETPAYSYVADFLADGETTRSYGFDPSRYAYLGLSECGVLPNGSNGTLLTVSGQEIRIILQQAEVARQTLNSRFSSSSQKEAAQRLLLRARKIYNRILEAGKVLSTWLNKGGWSRNIGAMPTTSTVQVPLITPSGVDGAKIGQTQSIARMPVSAFVETDNVFVFVEDIHGTQIGWNGEQVAPDFRLGLDEQGNILGLVYNQGNLECAVPADALQSLLDDAVERTNEDGYATVAIMPASNIVRFSEDAPFKSLGDIVEDGKTGSLVLEAVTTTEHSVVDATNLFAPNGYTGRTIRSALATDKGETRIVRTAETLRIGGAKPSFVKLSPQDDRTGSARSCKEPLLAKVG